MYITIVAASKNFNITLNLGNISADLINKASNNALSAIKLLKYVDPYDNTFYNRAQLIQIQKEISYLKQLGVINDQLELKTLEKGVNTVIDNPHIYHYLWLIGD